MYNLTNHAKQRMQERNIGIDLVERAYAIASTKVGKTQCVAVYFNKENVYVAFDTKEFDVLSVMYMHEHRIKQCGSGLRAAQAHARANHTYVIGV